MPISIVCPGCQKGYSVSDQLAGRGAKCQACGHVIQIPPAADRAGTAGKSDGSGQSAANPDAARIAELFDEEFGDEGAPGMAGSVPRCPSCGCVVSPDAVLCVDCGFNFKKGRQIAVKTDAAAASKSDTKKRGAPAAVSATVLGPSAVEAAGLRQVRVGLEFCFWSLIGTYTVLAGMFGLSMFAIAKAIVPGRVPDVTAALAGLAYVLLAVAVFNLVGRVLCLWVPRRSGARQTMVWVVVMDGIYLASPLWVYLLNGALAAHPALALVAIGLAVAVNLMPIISSLVFVAFLKVLARYVRRTDLSEIATSLLATILAAILLLVALPAVMAVLGIFLPLPLLRVMGAINLLLMLAVAIRLMVAVFQYALLLWRLKTHIAQRL